MSAGNGKPHCIVRRAVKDRGRAPLLFVHGAFTGAWCWDEHFLAYFAERGHDAWAVDLRGHGLDGEEAGFSSIEDYVDDVLAAVERIGARPVLLGHSMGAIVVQRAWRRAQARALALLAPVPLQGLLGSSLMLALNSPQIFMEINGLQSYSGLHPGSDQLQQAIFSPELPAADARRYLLRMRHESQRALFDLSWPQQPWIERTGIPLRVFAAERDRLFPPQSVAETAQWHGGDVEILPDVAHAMMLDAGWRHAASRIAGWLDGLPD
ncbi:MAG: alpha/beta fold hydrolase [Burkholderiales bacterium]|nr:alpha/beta fold hydrolase [Burkholderiales bacterium]